jgi:hypothetical protein
MPAYGNLAPMIPAGYPIRATVHYADPSEGVSGDEDVFIVGWQEVVEEYDDLCLGELLPVCVPIGPGVYPDPAPVTAYAVSGVAMTVHDPLAD